MNPMPQRLFVLPMFASLVMIFFVLSFLAPWFDAVAGKVNQIQIAQSNSQILNGTWITEKQETDSDNASECLFNWKIDKAVISGNNISLFLVSPDKIQEVLGEINVANRDFDTERKLSVEFSDGVSEIYVQFAGNFRGEYLKGWYIGAKTDQGLGKDSGKRIQCSGDFTLVSENALKKKANSARSQNRLEIEKKVREETERRRLIRLVEDGIKERERNAILAKKLSALEATQIDHLAEAYNHRTIFERKSIQQRLFEKGLYRSTIDGKLGSGTRSAIEKYARSNGNFDLKSSKGAETLITEISSLQSDTGEKRRKIKAKIAAKRKRQELNARQKEIEARDQQTKIDEEIRRKKQEGERKSLKEREAKVREENERRVRFRPAIESIFGGNDRDVVYLLNIKSPMVTRDLEGKFVFVQKKSKSCFVSPTQYNIAENRFVKEAHAKIISKANLNSLSIRQCGPLSAETSPILIVQISTKISMDRKKLDWILDHHVNGEYIIYYIASSTEFAAKITAENMEKEESRLAKIRTEEELKSIITEKRRDIESGLKTGQLNGFGLLKFADNPDTICSIKSDDPKVIKFVLETIHTNDKVFLKIPHSMKIESTTVNQNFMNIKLDRCAYFVGNAKSLKLITSGLIRDGIKYILHHNWVTLDDLPNAEVGKNSGIKSKSKTNPKQMDSVEANLIKFAFYNYEVRSEVGDGFNNFEANDNEKIIGIKLRIENLGSNEVNLEDSKVAVFLMDPLGNQHIPSSIASAAYAVQIGLSENLPRIIQGKQKMDLAIAFTVKRSLWVKDGWRFMTGRPGSEQNFDIQR